MCKQIGLSKRKKIQHNNGFTLIEAMTVVAILAILSMITIPSYVNYLGYHQIQSIQKNLYSTLRTVRLKAITNAQNVIMCASENLTHCIKNSKKDTDWSAGWIVFLDINQNNQRDTEFEELLSIQTSFDNQHVKWNRGSWLSYNYDGKVNMNGSFFICSQQLDNKENSRAIIINRVGRPYQSNKTASGNQITC
ncbi:GspH/FimT family pseudopilin [Marinicellulosiphila megalodicopiae]|uniref:GspH/FimT family pseudopilin n=1 Tax=Marinicellulosiphila megalodicopiae TaxID=2724896 RepID=UPI003BAF11CE